MHNQQLLLKYFFQTYSNFDIDNLCCLKKQLTQWLLKINNWSTLVITNVVCVNGLGLTPLCKCK
jgi:hypothetical protein